MQRYSHIARGSLILLLLAGLLIGLVGPRMLEVGAAPILAESIVNVTSTSPDQVYTDGDTIPIDVIFSGVVTVTGLPTLLLETGTTDDVAIYASGSGSSTLTFNYAVSAGDMSLDLDYVATDSLALNGGTITDSTGNTVLTLPSPGTPGSLSANKAIVIDNGSQPEATSFVRLSPSTSTTSADVLIFRVTFSEGVTNVDGSDFSVSGATGTIISSAPISPLFYDVTVSGGNLASLNGIVGLDLSSTQNITDLIGDTLRNQEPPIDETYTMSNICTTTNTTTQLTVVVNEVAWAGTAASKDDEWIELYNPPGGIGCTILDGWILTTDDGTPTIDLSGHTIDDGSYYLLERTDDNTVKGITADQIYPGTQTGVGDFLDTTETLYLYNNGNRIDSANIDHRNPWPAGSTSSYRSMERYRSDNFDLPTNWVTNTGVIKNGQDANNNAIFGTPRQPNWAVNVTLTPSPTPRATATRTRKPTSPPPTPFGRPVINEFLPRPGFDWNQDGKIDVFDEFIEIKNIGPIAINIGGWTLDDGGTNSFSLPSITLDPGDRVVFYGLETNILLSDGGDQVRLLSSGGVIMDSYTYGLVKEVDQSWCRMPEGRDWYDDCVPTPGLLNTREGEVPAMPPRNPLQPAICQLPDTLPSDFLFAECNGYGANMWSSMYWDEDGWQGEQLVPDNESKWQSFIQ